MAHHGQTMHGAPPSLRLVSSVPGLLDNVGDTGVADIDEPTSPLVTTVARIVAPATPPREVGVGDTLRSRYVLEQIVGQGGDSIVYRAADLHRVSSDCAADGPVAIKVLRPEHRLDPNALRRLKRQFRQMQSLSHPGIARVFDLDRDGDIWFISMELVAGQTVNAWIQESEHFSQGVDLIGACGEALEHAHSRGILHGDLKPSNVLVARDGSVKLIDFGSAPSAEPRTDAELEPSAAATASYASPQVLAGGTPEERDDIFSLACLSYVILSKGRRPFDGKASLQPAFVPDIPVRLYAVVLRGLAAERELRPGSVREFVHELISGDLSLHAGHADVPSSIPAPAASVQPSSRRSLAVRRAILIGLVLMIIGAALLIQQAIQGRTAPTQPLPSAIPEKILAPVSTVPPAVTAQPVASSAAVSEMLPHSNAKVHASGTITFDSASINVTEAQSLIAIQIRRLHSTRGSVSVAWVIEGGTARPAVDYAALDQGVVRLVEGQAVRSIFIPLLKRGANATSGRPGTLVVALRQVAGGPVLGPVRRATVTISPLGRLEAH